MVKVIEFVIKKGPAFGYRLNMKKCIHHSMAPTAKRLTVLTALGIPLQFQNIKIHLDYQSGLPPDVLVRRRI